MRRAFFVVAAAIGFLLYLSGLEGPFWLDDGIVLRAAQSFGWPTRPVGFASFWLNRHAMILLAPMLPWKEPFYYRLVNVFIHALAATAVFWLVRELTARWLAAGIAGMWFLVHPVQTQAITYITQRFESLAAMFMFFSAACYVRFRTTYFRRWLIAAAVFAAGAAFTKETAIILPAWLLLLELVFFGTKEIRRRILYTIPLGLILLIPAWRAFMASRSTLTWISWDRYFVLQGAVLSKYLELSTWPRQQFLFYGQEFSESLSWMLVAQWALVLGVIAFGVLCLRWNRAVGFGILSFFVLLLPVTLLPLPDVIVEHRVYPALAGVALAIGAAVTSFNRKSVYALVGIFMALLSMKTVMRNAEWNDPIAFMESHRRAFPQDAPILSRLAAFYYNAGHVNRALETNLEARKYEGRANTYYRQIGHVLTSVNLAAVYVSLSQFDKAEVEARRALAAKPDEAFAMRTLGYVQMQRHDFENARRTFEKYVAMRNDYDSWNSLRSAAALLGDTSTVLRAEDHLKEEQKKAEAQQVSQPQIRPKYKPYIMFGLVVVLMMGLVVAADSVQKAVRQAFRERKALKPTSSQQSSETGPDVIPPTS